MLILQRLKKRARSLLVGAAASGMVLSNVASVAALNSSSLLLSDPRPSPDSSAVTYTFDSSGYTASAVNCISLDFNTLSDGTGSVPAGMVTTGASLDASGTLITEASWTESFASNGSLDITFGAGETPAASGTLVYTGVTNPNTEDTFYAILTTYTNVDCTTGPTDNVTIAFTTKNGELVQLTIEPTLTFTCVGVTADTIEAVNGDVITHDSTASGINYLNEVTPSTNGVSAHDIDVTTNAPGGYIVYIRQTGQMINSNGDTIDNHTGTNLSPSNFSAPGTESWGYTTEDATLSVVGDGTDRFTTPAGDFAGFTTSNEEVIVNTAAVPGGETTRVGHQVGIASTTEAGTYQTTIVYTIVATF